MGKLKTVIRRADFAKSRDDLFAVQRIFSESQDSLIPWALSTTFEHFVKQPSFWAILIAIAGLAWMPLRSVVGVLVVLAVLLILLAVYLRRLASLGFKDLVRKVTTGAGDLSVDVAPGLYARDGNACILVCVPTSVPDAGRDSVIGSTCVLTGADANKYKNRDLGALGDGEGLVTRVGVLPAFHGAGAGRALLQAVIEYARERKLRRLRLLTSSAQRPAIQMYKKFGFVQTKITPLFPQFGFVELEFVLEL